ncbi:MAG: type II toxin-antitoxin system prevent-host-death family antitoxin [Pseudomonadota bacterium]|jgi:prevent-host-death family protein
MKEVAAVEAETKLAELLDLVEAGEEVLITRQGEPVARLTPANRPSSRERSQQAAAALRRHRQGVTLGDLELKALIDEGRR